MIMLLSHTTNKELIDELERKFRRGQKVYVYTMQGLMVDICRGNSPSEWGCTHYVSLENRVRAFGPSSDTVGSKDYLEKWQMLARHNEVIDVDNNIIIPSTNIDILNMDRDKTYIVKDKNGYNK